MQKIILTQNEKEVSIQFDPELNEANVGDYISTLLNTFPDAFLNVLTRTPLLRPACDEEKEAHVYVSFAFLTTPGTNSAIETYTIYKDFDYSEELYFG